MVALSRGNTGAYRQYIYSIYIYIYLYGDTYPACHVPTAEVIVERDAVEGNSRSTEEPEETGEVR